VSWNDTFGSVTTHFHKLAVQCFYFIAVRIAHHFELPPCPYSDGGEQSVEKKLMIRGDKYNEQSQKGEASARHGCLRK